MNLYDAHNHLQDERLAPHLESIVSAVSGIGVRRMVVNGSCEEDWPGVLALARAHPFVLPSFGYHPWYVRERSARWEAVLVEFLEAVPSAVGEIGLDRWIRGHDLTDQEEVFVVQLRLAAERNLPVSIHCLLAWGKLLEILQREALPHCGLVLHSYGGPREMVEPLARLGAYFSLPGYFALTRKERQRDAFRAVPLDRLLIETDAPDQSLPPERVKFPLPLSANGKPVNHPANLLAVYEFAAELLGQKLENLAEVVETNFQRIFGKVQQRG